MRLSLFLTLALMVSGGYSKDIKETNTTTKTNSTKALKKEQLDPVYRLKIDKYPKFSTKMLLKSGKEIEFVSVKSMMNFYFHPERFPEYGVKSRQEVDKMFVKDYLTGEEINAKDAFYVFGSRLVGPHGDDLIPLSSKTKAQLFMKKYGGTRVFKIDKFTFGLIKYLDM